MNRAKKFCIELSKNPRLLKTLDGHLEQEIINTRKVITEANLIKGSTCNDDGELCSLKRNTQEQIIETNMKQYLEALNRYANELLPGHYDFSKSNKVK